MVLQVSINRLFCVITSSNQYSDVVYPHEESEKKKKSHDTRSWPLQLFPAFSAVWL